MASKKETPGFYVEKMMLYWMDMRKEAQRMLTADMAHTSYWALKIEEAEKRIEDIACRILEDEEHFS